MDSEMPMITLFPKAETKPEELPADPALARLAFLARHLDDLQTIRLAGIPIALIELPLLDRLPHGPQAVIMAVTIVLSVAWYYLVRRWFCSRYGRSWVATDMPENSWTPATIVGFVIFFLLMEWFDQLIGSPVKNHSLNVAGLIGISSWLGKVVRDRTNLPLRRSVYKSSGIASLVCFGPIILTGFTAHARRVQIDCLALYGSILFSLALFDAWLLHHTFAQTKAEGEGTA
jgi:hypothetical protein